MSQVVALKSEFKTPELVLNNVVERLPEIEEVYVVIKTKDNTWTSYASGNLDDIFAASFHLQNIASSVMRELAEDL